MVSPTSFLPRFRGRLHDPRTATAVGRWLGAAVAVSFVTGLISHYLQHPPHWLALHLPTRPVWGYRVSQGLHVATGIALVPLLLVKLWTVYPRLFVWPPVRSVRHALERLSIAVLVSSALLEVLIGLLNIVEWYAWSFRFREVHWALAWVMFGSLLLHVAVKAPVIAAHWRPGPPGARRRAARPASVPGDADAPDVPGGGADAAGTADADGQDGTAADRRSLLLGMGAAVGTVTVVTAGQAFPPLRELTLLAPRDLDYNEQGLPVNRTAAQAGLTREGVAAGDWRLRVAGPRGFALSLEELRAWPQRSASLPIACVEGWSASAEWTGVRLRDLVDRAGAPPDAFVRVTSAQTRGAFRVMEMPPGHVRDPLTLLALRLNGEVLSPNHGFPARIIAPNRPGVWQTKWVTTIEVLR